jgi:hypothetical protein
MEPTTTPDPTCFRCEQPALTFDEQHRPLCGRHATIFLSDIRAKVFGEGVQESEKASEQADPEPASREYGFRLHLVPVPEGSGPEGDGGDFEIEAEEGVD